MLSSSKSKYQNKTKNNNNISNVIHSDIHFTNEQKQWIWLIRASKSMDVHWASGGSDMITQQMQEKLSKSLVDTLNTTPTLAFRLSWRGLLL